jgi:hypothetical protein
MNLEKTAVPAKAILPGATATARAVGQLRLPHPSPAPIMNAPWAGAEKLKGVFSPSFQGADQYTKTIAPQRLAKMGTGENMDLETVKSAFLDELNKIAIAQEKTASPLTEQAREHISKKNFAVSAKASNTGKPAYPIEDKAHARAALGFAAMHHDKKDLAEVRKDVAAKFPGMEQKKKDACMETGVVKKAFALVKESFDPKGAIHAGLAEAGPALGATAGAALMGGMGRNPLTGAAAGYGLGSIPEMLLGRSKAKRAA